VLLAATLLGVSTFAGSIKKTDSKASAEGDKVPECCQQMMQAMRKGEMNMTNMMPGMMQSMGPEVMERMQVLMRTPIFLDAPCPIYAQSDKLGLNGEQKKKLGEIENEARQQARAVLTPEQQAKLGNVPDKPVTMMETCPMMKMMQGMQQEPAPSAGESKKTK